VLLLQNKVLSERDCIECSLYGFNNVSTELVLRAPTPRMSGLLCFLISRACEDSFANYFIEQAYATYYHGFDRGNRRFPFVGKESFL